MAEQCGASALNPWSALPSCFIFTAEHFTTQISKCLKAVVIRKTEEETEGESLEGTCSGNGSHRKATYYKEVGSHGRNPLLIGSTVLTKK